MFLLARAGKSSVEILANFSFPVYSLLVSSSTGASIRHGPHQEAQKSTITGNFDFTTSVSNDASVSSRTIFMRRKNYYLKIFCLDLETRYDKNLYITIQLNSSSEDVSKITNCSCVNAFLTVTHSFCCRRR